MIKDPFIYLKKNDNENNGLLKDKIKGLFIIFQN